VRLREKPRQGEKPRITHRIVVIGSGQDVLLAFDFDGVKFMCAISRVYNGWRLSIWDILLGGPSIIRSSQL
jgi:hypothetical protein